MRETAITVRVEPDVTTLRLNVQSQTIDCLQRQIDLLSRRSARLERLFREHLADHCAGVPHADQDRPDPL